MYCQVSTSADFWVFTTWILFAALIVICAVAVINEARSAWSEWLDRHYGPEVDDEELDTCSVVETEEGPVRVRGEGELSSEGRAALAEVVRAARAALLDQTAGTVLLLDFDDMAWRLGKSRRWVQRNAEQLGGGKVGGRWVFEWVE